MDEVPSPSTILAATPFFTGVLSPEEINRLASGTATVKFDAGDTLVREDEPGDSMFIIVRGEAEVTLGESSKPRHLANLAAGDIVGEGSLLTGATRSATVTATTPIVALEVTKAAIEPILNAEPRLVDRFAAMLERRQAEVDRIYGAGHWNLFGLDRHELAPIMRTFFGGGV